MAKQLSPGAVQRLLKGLRERAGLSVRDCAEYHPNYGYYEGARFKKPYIPVDLADRLASPFAQRGVDPADLYALAGVEEAMSLLTTREDTPGMGEAEAAHYKIQGETDNALVSALAPGLKNADAWIIRSRALDLAGLLPGDVAIVDLNAAPEADDTVCAQIYDWRAAEAVTVFRLYDPPYLVAASTDPQFRRPQLVDDDRVSIKGAVVASFRRRP